MIDQKLTIDLSGVGNDIPTRLGKSRPTLTVDWHYRIPYQHYSRIFASQNLEIISWHTNGVFPVYSNKLERILEILSTQLITDLDLTASKIFKGFGANYFAILKKSNTMIDTPDR